MTLSLKKKLLKMHPAVLVLASFVSAIVLGAALLMLPFATKGSHIAPVDALFTATSAVCVTGLVVVDTGSFFTLFGQLVILALIQVGGLGVMTISVLMFRWLGKSLSIKQRMAMQDIFAHTPRHDILDLVKSVLVFTLSAEIVGALLLAFTWYRPMPLLKALYWGLFHSVSAFCNAGFALFPDSLMGYSDQLVVVATVSVLIVLGGIGFPVLYDIQSWIGSKQKRRLSVQTKTVLLTSAFLIAGGAAIIAALEYPIHPEPRSLSHMAYTAFFQSITCRTAGFNTIDIVSCMKRPWRP